MELPSSVDALERICLVEANGPQRLPSYDDTPEEGFSTDGIEHVKREYDLFVNSKIICERFFYCVAI